MIQTAQLDGDQGNGILHQPQIQQKRSFGQSKYPRDLHYHLYTKTTEVAFVIQVVYHLCLM